MTRRAADPTAMATAGRLARRRHGAASGDGFDGDRRPHLRGVFDALLDPTILIRVGAGPSFKVVAANQRAQEMLGFEEHEIVGQTPEQIRGSGPGSSSPEEYREVVARREPLTREHTFEVSGTTRVLRIGLN